MMITFLKNVLIFFKLTNNKLKHITKVISKFNIKLMNNNFNKIYIIISLSLKTLS